MMDVAAVVSGEVSNTTDIYNIFGLVVGNDEAETEVTIVNFLFDANVEEWNFVRNSLMPASSLRHALLNLNFYFFLTRNLLQL